MNKSKIKVMQREKEDLLYELSTPECEYEYITTGKVTDIFKKHGYKKVSKNIWRNHRGVSLCYVESTIVFYTNGYCAVEPSDLWVMYDLIEEKRIKKVESKAYNYRYKRTKYGRWYYSTTYALTDEAFDSFLKQRQKHLICEPVPRNKNKALKMFGYDSIEDINYE